MIKKITGKWEYDGLGWRHVYENNTIWIENLKKHTWDFISVGERTADYKLLTQEKYDEWESRCKETGTFEVKI